MSEHASAYVNCPSCKDTFEITNYSYSDMILDAENIPKEFSHNWETQIYCSVCDKTYTVKVKTKKIRRLSVKEVTS